MISLEKALEIALKCATKMKTESMPLLHLNGRVLAADIFSDVDMPPFDKSAMDGYACRRMDLDMPLRIIETIPAGHTPTKQICAGECAKIMTGAMVPEGADYVIMLEHTKEENGYVHVTLISDLSNICRKAEDIQKGQLVLKCGTVISPKEMAVLASVGSQSVPVASQPVVGIIATGRELVEPDRTPSLAQIRNSNSYQLWAQTERAGCIPRYFGIVPDDPDEIARCIKDAVQSCDVILLSGGVSMGDYDFVPYVLRQSHAELKFDKIAVKPGRPTIFGIIENRFFFGLPGNPVSTFVLFEILVKPFLFKLMGCDCRANQFHARLSQDFTRNKIDRSEFIPVFLDWNGYANFIDYHGSANINALINANGILMVPQGVGHLDKDSEVIVNLI